LQQWFFIEIFFFSLTAWETWKIACKARHWLYVNSETEKKKAYMVLIKHIVPLTLLQQFSHSSWYPYSLLRLLWDLFCMWIWNRAKQSMHVKNQTKTLTFLQCSALFDCQIFRSCHIWNELNQNMHSTQSSIKSWNNCMLHSFVLCFFYYTYHRQLATTKEYIHFLYYSNIAVLSSHSYQQKHFDTQSKCSPS